MELTGATTSRLTTATFAELDAAEYRADLVIRLYRTAANGNAPGDDAGDRSGNRDDDCAAEAIIVEVQLDRDSKKRRSWPRYITGVHSRLGCLATLLVITIDDRVAAWCARPIPLDRNGSVIRPLVLGPRTLPRVTDIEQASRFPELAVLSAVARGNDHDAAEIAAVGLVACSGLDSPRSTRYADFIMASLDEAARNALEALMTMPEYEYQSDFARNTSARARQGRT